MKTSAIAMPDRADPTLAKRLQRRAIALLSTYRLEEAEESCVRALSLKRGRNGSALELADTMATLAQIRETRWKHRSAESLYRRVSAMLPNRGHRAEVLILRVAALSGLGRIALTRGKYAAAETLLRRAVRTAGRLGRGHVELGRTLGELGVLYRYMGRLADAARLYRRSLEILQKSLGPRDSHVAHVHHMLAGVEHLRGRLARAESSARRSVRIREAALGPNHPDVAADVAALAAILAQRGRTRLAEQSVARALRIFRRTFGDEHYEVAANLGTLAAIRDAQGRVAEATGLFRRALAMKERILGPNHPELVIPLNNLSVVLSRQGKRQEADRLARRARRIVDRSDVRHPQGHLLRKNWDRLIPRFN